MSWSRTAAMTALLTMAACRHEPGARPQILVYVDTDAPVPRMIDRLRLRVLDDRLRPACDACEREIAIGADAVWPLSFGVMPRTDSGKLHVQVILYPQGRTSAGSPHAATAIERIAALPDPDGVAAVLVFAGLDCAGRPSDPSARTTCGEPIVEAPPYVERPSLMGTWHAEVTRPCAGEPSASTGGHDEEVCIPGGVYWMGDARIVGLGAPNDAVPEHPVAVTPFFMDKYEFTVGRYRQALARGFKGVPAFERGTFKGSTAVGWSGQDCNFTTKRIDLAQDDLPLNCVPAELADQLCAFDGRRLPTEAQWEWAAGNREAENLYPWGDYALACIDLPEPDCGLSTPSAKFGWPVGSHPLDRTKDGVMDMTQNVTEWVLDTYARYDEPCWSGPTGIDPICKVALDAPWGRSVRGDHYYTAVQPNGMIPYRQVVPVKFIEWFMGFRCARDDR